MDALTQLVSQASDFLWNVVLIIILCGTGIYYTIRLKFIQVRKFREGWHQVFGNFSLSGKKKEKSGNEGEMTSFQSVATAIAAQVGTGNLAGAATALIGGGPGAIFWMWMSAFFGMSTIYAEATLAQQYKTTFAVLIIIALGFTGNMVQSNSIGSAFYEVFQARGIHIPQIVFGIILAAIAGFIFLGGVDRLASVVEKLVPLMAGIYIVGSLILIFMHIGELPNAFRMIFVGAFNPKAVLGAGAGIAVREAIRYGVARGLFSNEAGMGSTPHAHARANVENPHKQGLAAMISVFIDTFVVLNLTVFSILTTGVLDSGKTGTALTQAAFTSSFGGFGDIFVAVCLFFFAFSTILGWHFFGKVNIEYLFGTKATIIYSLLVIVFVVVGSTLKVDFVWSLSDFFNGLMVIPNALALWALSGVVIGIAKKFGGKK